MRRAEDRLKEVVDELLQRAFRGQQASQVDLRDHLVVTFAVFVVVPLMPHEMPEEQKQKFSMQESFINELINLGSISTPFPHLHGFYY